MSSIVPSQLRDSAETTFLSCVTPMGLLARSAGIVKRGVLAQRCMNVQHVETSD
jgi:hypothetical protein